MCCPVLDANRPRLAAPPLTNGLHPRAGRAGGHLCVCDFTVDPATQWSIMQYFWKKLFASDHVHLNEEV